MKQPLPLIGTLNEMINLGADTDFKAAGTQAFQAVRNILVVDDSRSLRVTVSRMLRRAGFEVREADSGQQALQLCEDAPPDLVLSDWMMPGMNGLEFCRRFRAMPRDGYGYFILLTSKSEKTDVARGFDAGADDFLTKPVNGIELRARLTAAERVLRMEKELTEKNRLIRVTLDELQDVYESIRGDLVEARKLQQSLVTERHKDFGSAEVSLLLRSASHVGGDLVGLFPISDDHVGLYGIDVSGHGISSALMTARLAGYLSATSPDRNIALMPDGLGGYQARCPAQTVAILNDLILGEIETEHYFTLLLADADLRSGRITFAQAGHPCPLVQRTSGECEVVGRGGLPVGLLEHASYEPCEIQLNPGDRFLIYSDGITECTDPAGGQLGDDGICQLAREHREIRGPAFLEAMLWQLSSFAGRDSFDDDVSAVLFEFEGLSRNRLTDPDDAASALGSLIPAPI